MAKTLAGTKFYVCSTAQESDLNQAGYEALTWVQVGNVGKIGETGTKTNIVGYDDLASTMKQKSKGLADAGDPTIECARNPTDAGQIIMRTIGAPTDKKAYAFKIEKNDAPSASYTNTIHYVRGICTGPSRPNGALEDFDLEVFTLGLTQAEITVNPAAI